MLTPEEELIEFALELLLSRCLNSKQFCILMHHAGKAGLSKCQRYGFKPGASTGHYSRHLDPLLGFKQHNTSFYEAELPSHNQAYMSRELRVTPVLPIHETLIDDMVNTTGAITKLTELIAARDLPPAYFTHPVVTRFPDETVVPIALYLDYVPYTLTDSVLGVWVRNVVTDRRYLFAVIRKRTLCTCGCKGWCTYHSLFSVLTWSLRALAVGRWPDQRHDRKPWREFDTQRATRAGEELMFKAAVLYIQGDWSEYAHTLGLPAWNDGLRPCFGCAAFGEDMFETEGCSPDGLRWRCNDEHSYDQACGRCEIKVRLTERTRDDVVERLFYDRRDAGARGRALTRAVPGLRSLVVGDRLEPDDTLTNVGCLEYLPMPAVVTFWRRTNESVARHRNPLFADDIGISVHRCLTVDVLHTLYLGVMKTWCKLAAWCLISAGVYGNAADGNVAGVLVFRHRLFQWYTSRQRRQPSENLTRVADFTVKMIGTRDDPKFKTKGAETWGLLLFLVGELRTFIGRVGDRGVRLALAGEALESLVRVWNRHTWILPAPSVQDILDQTALVSVFVCVLALFACVSPAQSTRNAEATAPHVSDCSRARNASKCTSGTWSS